MGTKTDWLDVDAELARFEAEERARLGLDGGERTEHWTDRMIDPQFGASQRAHTTILVGGLTMAHDYLVEGALGGLGYRVRALPCPDEDSLRAGKEFGNRAQCNPTYFTVGNVVKELLRLEREEGLSKEEIVRSVVFLTAGACGPCRFGMYATEYRKALRDAGFDGFRVMLFQQTGGLKQATGEDAGLDLSPPFFIAIAKALFAGDVLNLIGYRLRPYEVEAGATDRALTEAKKIVYDVLATPDRGLVDYLMALRRAREPLAKVEVDRLRAKPKVSILGEFWAMTTEGDGNYHLQRFLEAEGAENEIQVLVALLLYNLWEIRHDTLSRAELRGADAGQFGLEGVDVGLKVGGMWLGELLLRSVFQLCARLTGLRGYRLPDMDELARIGHSHYNVALRGGEGHLEVAKLMLNVAKQKSHMTLSVKPFGCMPSSGVSDGVQTVITERFPEAIFCAVETSGDGSANFYSRVQMYLLPARQRAQRQHAAALERLGITEAQAREFLASPAGARFRDPLFHPYHTAAGTSVDLLEEIAPYVGKSALERAWVRARLGARDAKRWCVKDGAHWLHVAGEVAPYLPALAKRVAIEAGDALPSARRAWDAMTSRVLSRVDVPEIAPEVVRTVRVREPGTVALPVL